VTRDQTFVDQGTAARGKDVARLDSPYARGTRRGVLWTLGWDQRECRIARAEHRLPNIPEIDLPLPAAKVSQGQIERTPAPIGAVRIPLQQRMQWSQGQLNGLYAGLRQSATGIELAQELGVGLVEIFYKALEFDLGLPTKHDGNPWSEADNAEATRMREARYSARLIGFALGRTMTGVQAHFAVMRRSGQTVPAITPKRLFRRAFQRTVM